MTNVQEKIEKLSSVLLNKKFDRSEIITHEGLFQTLINFMQYGKGKSINSYDFPRANLITADTAQDDFESTFKFTEIVKLNPIKDMDDVIELMIKRKNEQIIVINSNSYPSYDIPAIYGIEVNGRFLTTPCYNPFYDFYFIKVFKIEEEKYEVKIYDVDRIY